MAIIKVYFRKNAKTLLNYIEKDGEAGSLGTAINCVEESAASDFETTRVSWKSKGENQAMHVIQSWSAKESSELSADQFHEMGMKLAQSYFPGHEVVIKTHTDTENTHNHIVVNMVNFETGKMLENKKHHLYRLRDLSDKICLDKGLSVINKDARDRQARLPDKVLRMNRFNRFSYVFDTKNKADFARKYSTNYDEYVSILGEMGIRARVEEKNVTYFYPGKKIGKRGDKLGKEYDKPGLEKDFKANDELFNSRPELRLDLTDKLATLKNGSTVSKAAKDYTQFTKVKRRTNGELAAEKELKSSVIPLGEIRRARQGSIFEYCKRNNIAVVTNEKGESVLKGRTFVSVTDQEWVNGKNKTRGSLIEFVAAHKSLSLVQAIAHINNNPTLLLLEQHFGEQKRTFTSFHVPKQDSMDWGNSVRHVAKFLSGFHCRPDLAGTLLRKQQVQVDKKGVIRFFAKDDMGGAQEFSPQADGKWSKQSLGAARHPFYSSRGTGSKLFVFIEPLSLLKKHEQSLFPTRTRSYGILALLQPSHEVVDYFIAKNKHVKDLFLVTDGISKPSRSELDFFNNLKSRYLKLGIEIHQVHSSQALQVDGHNLSR